MSVSHIRPDDSLRLGDAANDWRAAWLIPVRDDRRPGVLAELSVDDAAHTVTLGRAEVEALRRKCDEILAHDSGSGTVYGIRPHRPMTQADADLARRHAEQATPDPVQTRRLLLNACIPAPAPAPADDAQ